MYFDSDDAMTSMTPITPIPGKAVEFGDNFIKILTLLGFCLYMPQN